MDGIHEVFNNPSQQLELLQDVLIRYYGIKEKGGWSTIKATKKFYQKGQKDAVVVQIKKRLHITGEFTAEDFTEVFTNELKAAVEKAQKQFGQKVNGVVDAQLIKQLNVPVDVRIQQLEANISRLQNAKPVLPGTRLVANIPEFRLYVYEGDQPVFDMAIVVGTKSNRTVVFDDSLTHVVFSPYWNVPRSIVRNEILPAMRKSSSYLRRNGYEQTGTENGLPVIRQKPGANNSLGRVKFIFPNKYNIYFHDTPARSLFELSKRTFSHGCIRLAEPAKLAEYLFRNSREWTPGKIKKAMLSGREQWVELDQPVAVSITYYTAWVDDEGVVHFREDVYGLDKQVNKIAMK